MRTGHYPHQTLGAVGQPVRAVTPPLDRPGLPEMSEATLWRAKRHPAHVCLCHGDRLPWWDWSPAQWAAYERQQRQAAMATIAAEIAAEREERTA